ncbi:PE family protein, partial [Mycobacterium asiaticum]|uniref:PE family protein n=1 Tax=Mycobacterium asiaticum TaxID=1790 RepID=UPI000A8B2145
MTAFVIVTPEVMTTAAADLARIESALRVAHEAAAASTTQVLAAAGDEVSKAVATLFSAHGQEYQALKAQAAAFSDGFVRALAASGVSYANAEAAATSPLQAAQDAVMGVINSPFVTLTGRPLIGDGANGLPGTGQAGGAGGWLIGNGGNGGSGMAGTGNGAGGTGGAGGAAGLWGRGGNGGNGGSGMAGTGNGAGGAAGTANAGAGAG